MNKKIAALCAAALMLSATGCGQAEEASIEQLLSEELTGEITVSCYDTMMYKNSLEAAAKAFEAKNPGTKVNIEAFAPMPEIKTMEKDGARIATIAKEEDSQDKAEYISKINTELMSGEGADILAMDILPYYKYADRAQLEDLQKYMDADSDFNRNDYRKNIIDALKYNGGQYVMPMDYSFDYLAFDSSLFTEEEQQNTMTNRTYTYDQLIKAAEKPFERANNNDSQKPIRMFGASAYSKQQPSMFSEMLQQNYGAFVDMENKKVNLTDGSFAGLLNSLKTYGENGYFTPNSDSSESKAISIEDFKKVKEEKFFYKLMNHFTFLSKALEKSGSKVMLAFGTMSSGNDDNDKTLGLLASDNGEVSFNYSQAYGINANSDNKALSWAFIKYLMSKEMQAKLEFTRIGLPINNAARLEKAKTDITGISFNKNAVQMPASGSIELNESQQAALDQYVKTIEDFSDLLNYCPIKDDTVNTMINDEVSRYFDGSKTAEEVAETLQEKIELYLNE